jgi:hypothetical protein
MPVRVRGLAGSSRYLQRIARTVQLISLFISGGIVLKEVRRINRGECIILIIAGPRWEIVLDGIVA